jgi:PKD domain
VARALRVLLLASALCFAAPGAAAAATFCVNGPCPSGATTHATLDDALAAAALTGERDRIEIGPGTLSATNSAVSTPVDIVGAGAAATTLEGAAGSSSYVLDLAVADSSVSDLTVRLADGSPRLGLGVGGGAVAERIDVTASTGMTSGTGVVLSGGGRLERSRVLLHRDASAVFGVLAFAGPGPAAVLEDVEIDATVGLDSAGSGTVNAHRLAISASQGVRAGDGVTNLSVAAIRISGDFGRALLASTSLSGSATRELHAAHVTAIGDGSASSSGAAALSSHAGRSSTVTVRDSILRGFTADIRRESTDGVASFSVNYTSYVTQSDFGTGTFGGLAGVSTADPQFVDAAAGDYRLAPGSPLIDAGDPASPYPEESATDFRGEPRVADGNGDGSARSDIGAWERQPPVIGTALATPASVRAGAPASFSAAATDVDDDPLTYSWSFDDGSSAIGSIVDKAFAAAGGHSATLTVTDPAGARATATVPLEVAAVVDGAAPDVELSLSPSRFRVGRAATPLAAQHRRRAPVGTTFRYRLSEAATVRIAIERALPGRRRRGACRAPGVRPRGRRCTRYRTLGTLTRSAPAGPSSLAFSGRLGSRALRPGRYRATLVATDAAGNASRPARAAFTVVAR